MFEFKQSSGFFYPADIETLNKALKIRVGRGENEQSAERKIRNDYKRGATIEDLTRPDPPLIAGMYYASLPQDGDVLYIEATDGFCNLIGTYVHAWRKGTRSIIAYDQIFPPAKPEFAKNAYRARCALAHKTAAYWKGRGFEVSVWAEF